MKIELLVGMIASGKSTYAKKRADEGALVVSHDDLTEMLHACYRYESGKRDFYRACENRLVEAALDYGFDVVIDRTHLTKESRARWVAFAVDHGVDISAAVFPVCEAWVHATRRYECDARGRHYMEWLTVAKHHAEQAANEPIELSEGFSEILKP